MKTIKKHFKIVALLFSILILFQGCTVYKSTNVSLVEASNTDLKARVMKTDGEKEKYARIVVLEDGQYYGRTKAMGKNMYNHILINENEIEKIQLKDKTSTIILNIAFPAIIITVLIMAVKKSVENSIGF